MLSMHKNMVQPPVHINWVWSFIPVILLLRRRRQEGQVFKVMLGNIASLEPVWTTQDLVSKSTKTNKQKTQMERQLIL